jgi:hypothetical protein
MEMRPGGPEQDATECPSKGQQPVVQVPAHGAGRSPNQVRDDDPRLLGEEGRAEKAVSL